MVSVRNSAGSTPVAPPVGRVVVTGGAGLVGGAVLRALAADPSVASVVSVDLREPDPRPAGVEHRSGDLLDLDLVALLEGADAVVHLAAVVDPILDDVLASRTNVEGTQRLLDAVATAGVRTVVRVSSAAVYGAWPTNPRPLTEDSPLRPVPGHGPAVQAAEVERRLVDWRSEHPEVRVTTFRAAPVVGRGAGHLWARTIVGPNRLRVRGADRPVQVVHPDDVASAVTLAVTGALDGVYNLAADGWMTAEACDALQSRARMPALPAELLDRLLARSWRSGFGTVPPEVVPYLEHPWIVATDRVVAAGWRPSVSNEEAILEALDAVPAPRLDRRAPIAAALLVGGLLAGLALRRRGRG